MSWRRVRLKHLCEDAGQYGLNVSADQYTTTGVRLLRTSDINDDGTLKPDGDPAGQFVYRGGPSDLLWTQFSLRDPETHDQRTNWVHTARPDPRRTPRPARLASKPDGTLEPDDPPGRTARSHHHHHTAVYVDPDRPLDHRHRLQPGDLLLSRSGTLGRALLVPPHAAGATYAGYLVRFRPRHHTVDPRYLAYLATSTPFQDTVRAEAVTNTIANFNADRYANITVDLPPLHEQHRIADHLDRATARVRQLCALRERQTELARARTLRRMVDMMLNESATADPSHGARPTRLKHLFEFERAGTWGGEPSGAADDVVCVRVADFDRATFRAGASAATRRSVAPSQLAGRVLRDGDVLLERSGGGELTPVGCAVSYNAASYDAAAYDGAAYDGAAYDGAQRHHGRLRAVCSNFVSVLRPAAAHDARYVALLMAAVHHTGRSVPYVKQTMGIQNLDASAYLGQRVLVPDRRRQRALAAELDARLEHDEMLAAAQHRQLAVLHERQQALVTAAVTDRLDVMRG